LIIEVGTTVEKDVALESSALQLALRMEVACERKLSQELNAVVTRRAGWDGIFYPMSIVSEAIGRAIDSSKFPRSLFQEFSNH